MTENLPTCKYNVQTKTLSIGECANNANACEITSYVIQNSGPYQSYEKIILEAGPTKIQSGAFTECRQVKEIVISSTIEVIETPFCRRCLNLETIRMSSESEFFETDEYGSLYSKGKKQLVRSSPQKTEVVISVSTESILSQAFQYSTCTNLKIPKGVTSIAVGTFYDSKIQTISFAADSKIEELIEGSLSIQSYQLKSIEFPKSLKYIRKKAICSCPQLTQVIFPADSLLESIGEEAFKDDTRLKSIQFPDLLESISDNAFAQCSALASISLSKSLKNLSESAFSGCGSISSITIPSSNNYFTVIDGSLFSKNLSTLFLIPISAEKLTIDDNLLTIGQTALQLSPKLTSLNISDNHPKYMKNDKMLIDKDTGTVLAFVGGITSVNFPSGVKTLGDYCAYKCQQLGRVDLTDTISTIGDYCFAESSITEITMTSALQRINQYAFTKCNKMVKITFPPADGSIILEEGAFVKMKSKIEFIFNCDVENLPYKVFSESSATKIIFKKGKFTQTSNYAFSELKSLQSIHLPSSLKSISEDVFAGCSMTEVLFPNGCNVENIELRAFSRCSNLKTISFGESLTTIKSMIFAECTSLSSIDFPEKCKLKTIPSDVFLNCQNLETFNVPSMVTSVDPGAFTGCIKLTSITKNTNQMFESVEGILYEVGQGKRILRVCPPGIDKANVTEGVTDLGERCFYMCTILESVQFPKQTQFQTIGTSTFEGCSSLRSLSVPPSVQNITDSPFIGCTSLSSIDFSPNCALRVLDGDTFSPCKNLAEINLEECIHLSAIPTSCFSGCALRSIQTPSGIKTIGEESFMGCTQLISLRLNHGLTSISSRAFRLCTGLSEIKLPQSVLTIGSGAFESSGLKGMLEIPPVVDTVGIDALAGTHLRTIIFCGTNKLEEDSLGISKSSFIPTVHVTPRYPGRICLGSVPERDVTPECYIETDMPLHVGGVAFIAANSIFSSDIMSADD